jgi:nucleotide-binding universal stress UspA family protein
LSRREALEALSIQLLARTREQAERAGVREMHIESRTGDVSAAIPALVHEKGADVLVIGKRGHGV